MDFSEFALMDKDEEREKRKEKAAAAGCTPFSISVENQTGVFGGSGGRYNVSLFDCECMDFKRRKLPCKHIYRLAHELGVCDLGGVENDPDAIREARRKVSPRERAAAVDECIALIDGYPLEVQRTLQLILYANNKKRLYACNERSAVDLPLADGLLEAVDSPVTVIESNTQKRTVDGLVAAGFSFPSDLKPTKKARYEWCLENPGAVCACAYPDSVVVRPSEKLNIARVRVYSHLNRKFEAEYDYFH